MDFFPSDRVALQHLRAEWAAAALAAVGFALAGYFILRHGWDGAFALRWFAAAVLMMAYLFASLWKNLRENRLVCEPPAQLYGGFGLANRITILRAVLTAGLAGFLLVPRPPGGLAWAPGLIFMIASLLDVVDGAAARATGRPTVLGARLDMQWDSAGVLVASLLAVLYGQAPLFYALVGWMRYLYLAGLWMHRRSGGGVGGLPPSKYRRVIGGAQMIFIATILLPLFSPPWTHLAAVLFMAPVLLSFLRDYLVVTGRIHG